MRGGFMKFKIPFIKPNFPVAVDLADDYQSIVESNWFTNFGPYEQKFSAAAAAYIGSGVSATTISNCTLGLEAAIDVLLDRGKKRVIMPSFTFAAGAEALIRSGFEPVFIDILEGSLQPDISQAKHIIDTSGDDISGILLCNIFGVGNPDIDDWESLAHENSLPLIIDSAAGFGSRYPNGEILGARGDCEVFSMHATKPFAIGEGGLVASKNKELISKIRSWQNFGFESDRNIHRIGTNGKLQEINAAIGLRQLQGFEARLASRRSTLAAYKSLLGDNCAYQENDEHSTVPFTSVMFNSSEKAESVYATLLEQGIEVRRYYSPLHQQGYLAEFISAECPLAVTEAVAQTIVSLPTHDNMTQEDIERVVTIIKESLQ